ncbi:MAG TPA: hypothetical protein VEN81_00130 [Planctomycetota bacterium]|jgi:DNA-directed RNA polymerase subunit RPC12/RpoP|nr:hypothetical protein [Planctomycetota bacterium]
MRTLAVVALLPLAACASRGEEAAIVRKPHLARAGILPGQSIPADRDGMSASDTGAIMWICANSDKHEDKEVFVQLCPSCSNMNYFYWDGAESAFRCFACMKLVDNSVLRCPECGHPPRRVKTKPVAK